MKKTLPILPLLMAIVFSTFAQTPSSAPDKPANGKSDDVAAQQSEAAQPNTHKLEFKILQGFALRKVQPKYPKDAKKARVSGTVQVQVTISEKGRVTEAVAISGPEPLRKDSVKAAKKWEFKPTELEGVPVKVQGILTFNFTLQ